MALNIAFIKNFDLLFAADISYEINVTFSPTYRSFKT